MIKRTVLLWMVVLSCQLDAQSEETATLVNTLYESPVAGTVQEAGTISGTVIDLMTRKPVEKATVEILGTGSTAATAKDGQYTIRNVKRGIYQIKASAKGYVPDIRNNVQAGGSDGVNVFFELQMDPADPPENIEVDIQPNVIENPMPKYPESARKEGIEATVWLKMIVSEKGIPEQVQVIKSSVLQKNVETVIRDGSEEKNLSPVLALILKDFQQSAMECLRQWKFSPAVLKGKSVRVWVAVPVKYKLDAGHKGEKKK